jgi:hypothetical protein
MNAFDDAQLKERSFHRIQHPCHAGLDFRASEQGIYGAVMPENHHVFLGGVCKEIGNLFPMKLSGTSIVHTYDVLAYMVSSTRFPSYLKLSIVSPFCVG